MFSYHLESDLRDAEIDKERAAQHLAMRSQKRQLPRHGLELASTTSWPTTFPSHGARPPLSIPSKRQKTGETQVLQVFRKQAGSAAYPSELQPFVNPFVLESTSTDGSATSSSPTTTTISPLQGVDTMGSILSTDSTTLSTTTPLWLSRGRAITSHLERSIATEMLRHKVSSRVDRTLNRTTARAFCQGDVRLANIRKTLNNLGIIRSADQIKFHEAFLESCLPHIYKEDWNANSVRVMNEFAIKEIRYETLIMTPRRWGKTWSVATFVLSLLVNVPGIRLCIFSTGKRASGSLLQIVLDFLQKVPGGRERILKQNQEELFIAPPNSKARSSNRSSFAKVAEEGDNVSKLYSFPSSVTGRCHAAFIRLIFWFCFFICLPYFIISYIMRGGCEPKQTEERRREERSTKKEFLYSLLNK